MYKIIEECILKLDYLKYSITDNSINKRWIVDRFSNGRFYFSFKKDQQHHHDFNFTIFNYSRQLSFSSSFYYHLYLFFLGVTPIINSVVLMLNKNTFLKIYVVFFVLHFVQLNFIFSLFWSISLDHFSKPKLNIFEKYIEASIFKLCTTCDSLKKKKINSIGDYSKHVSPLSLLM